MTRFQSLGSHSWLGRASRLAVAAVVLAAGTPAIAELTTSTIPPPTTLTTTAFIGEGSWKIAVKPDATAAAAGRDPFTEYSFVDSTRVQMHEMSRLGFKQTALSATPGVISTTYTMTIESRECGKVVISGTATLTTNNGTAVWTTKDGKVYNYTFTGVPYTQVEAES